MIMANEVKDYIAIVVSANSYIFGNFMEVGLALDSQ